MFYLKISGVDDCTKSRHLVRNIQVYRLKWSQTVVYLEILFVVFTFRFHFSQLFHQQDVAQTQSALRLLRPSVFHPLRQRLKDEYNLSQLS